MMDKTPIFTVGYGSRSLEEFIALLLQHEIRFMIDVRSRPYSRFKPDFSKESLEHRLKQRGIQYVFLGDKLGGRPDDEACYTDGKVDYEKCREQPLFREGIARLRNGWEKNLRIALMCSEGKPEECHRSKLIGTSLVDNSIGVTHIDEKGELITQEQAIRRLTRGQLDLFGAPPETLASRKRYPSSCRGQRKTMKPKIVTIGVYRFDEPGFFQALADAKVDTFCDIRLRRGMRGSAYAFVNSARLQKKLAEMGIRYLHLKELAPSKGSRDKQKEEDRRIGTAKRSRERLGQAFVEAYESERLSVFDSARFVQGLGSNAEVVALFCVEREPEACHRSLVAGRLQQDLGVAVEHLQP
jgi:uncharacterized protein (DUF488 family)